MGAAAAIPNVMGTDNPPDVLYVNEKLKGKKKGFGFSRSMFSKLEWRTLKVFCLANEISQLDLNRMYNRYLSSDAAIVRQMRILLSDISLSFAKKSAVYQDIAEVLCPGIFLRDYGGLKDPYSSAEVSFARCIILGYVTCAQPISDMIFDFFAISRRSMNIKIVATLFAHNFKQCVKVFASELSNSAARRFLVEKCIGEEDEELSLLNIMQMGSKYPLLFYQLYLFQRHLKRLIFGDKFWSGRVVLQSRFDANGLSCEPVVLCNEKNCIRETARQILADFTFENSEIPRLYPNHRDPLIKLSVACCTKTKHALGYRWARALIEESELEYPDDQCFAEVPSDFDDDLRIHDDKIGSDFVYNAGTGYRAWVEKHKLRNGEVVKELWHRTSPKL